MAIKNVKPAGKIFIGILIVAGLFALYQFWLVPSGHLENIAPEGDNNTVPRKISKKVSKNTHTMKIGVVTWGGYAGGQYFNEGFEANTESRFYKEYGFMVEFLVLDDFANSRNAFKTGAVDLLWCTVDALPTEMEKGVGIASINPKFVFQADWSRGGDAIVATANVKTVADLRGKKIAVAEMTPSHSFLIWLLEAGGMTMNDVELVPVPSAIDAANMFKNRRVDAAVVWSPDDEACLQAVSRSHILENTKMATHIIADGFIVTEEYIKEHPEELAGLIEGWMRGAAEINQSETNKQKAARILSEGLGMPYEFCIKAIDNVRLATKGDNLDFFGMNLAYSGVTAEALYSSMARKYIELGYVNDPLPWRSLSYPKFVQSLTLKGLAHQSEAAKTFTVTEADKSKEAFATKQVSITFATGSYTLDNNSKYIIDESFVDVAKRFRGAKIRIEGNTDNTGSRSINLNISRKRADAVKIYLIREHGFNPDRFIVVGNGPDHPISDNNTENGRAQNRRTDFELIR